MQKTVDLGTGSVPKLLVRLALPAVLAQIINLLYNIIDRMYVGSIPEIGTAALAGLGVAFPVLLIVSAFSSFIGMGGAPLAAIKLGEKNREGAERIMNGGFVMLLLLSVVLTLILAFFSRPILQVFGATPDSMEFADSYLKIYALGTVFVLISLGLNSFISAQGFAKTSMFTVLIGAVLNIALDPLFIFVFHMGVKGAAIATVISQAASAIFVVIFLCGKRTQIRLRPKFFRLNWKILLPVFALGISPFIMQATESAVQIVFNVQLRKYTGNNTDYTAAMSIMLSVMQIVTLPINGLGMGAQPLISYNYGAGNFDRIKKAIRYLLLFAFCFSSVAWILCLSAPPMFARMFSASPSVTAIIRGAMPKFMLGTVLFAAQFGLQNCFLSFGQAKISVFLAILRKVILLIPLTLLFPLAMGVTGVYWAESTADIIAAAVTTTVFLLSYKKILNKRKLQLEKSALQ